MTDATERYLETVAADCGLLLGPGVEVGELEVETSDETILRLKYRLGATTGVSEGRGETVVEAHARLRRSIVEDRVGLGLRALV